MRKKAKDGYLMSLSKYNIVYYWHFITSSIIIIIVVVFACKTINIVNASTPEVTRDHLEREMMYDYVNYFLRVYEPYNDELNSDIENNELNYDNLENNSEKSDLDNDATKGETDISSIPNEDANAKIDYSGNSSEENDITNDKNNEFAKNEDNLDNTIEKSSEIVYNSISEDKVSETNKNVNNNDSTYESELSLKIVTDTSNYNNDNNSFNNTVASDDTLNTLRKLQLDYINKFYYNYVVEYYTKENADVDSNSNVDFNNSTLSEITLFDMFLLNELIADVEINEEFLLEEK